MVFSYTSPLLYTIFKGNQKNQNELLIKYAWPEDVWFHLDSISSPHIYLRLSSIDQFESIPLQVIHQCCQLVKGDSIQGSKKQKVDVVYTFASNLLKEKNMQCGSVGFKDNSKVKHVYNVKLDKEVLKRILISQKCLDINLKKQLQERKEKEYVLKHKERVKQRVKQKEKMQMEQNVRKKQKEERQRQRKVQKQLKISNKQELQQDQFM